MFNALKYFITFMAGVWVICYSQNGGQYKPDSKQWSVYFILFFITQMTATIYSWVWDCYMDWGLWRTTKPGKYGLRDTLTFPTWFYYYGIVSDAVLRLTWLIPIFLAPYSFVWLKSIGYGTLMGLLELWRRWTWSLLRIENEQVNNLERYRVVLDIPDIYQKQENI